MIFRKDDINTDIRHHLRGGAGEVKQKTLASGDCVPNLRTQSIQTIEKGATIGYHIHEDESEIYYILKGRASFNDNGKCSILNEGDLVITNGGCGHAVANAGDGELVLLATIIKA
jgi:quercetin dioxygenase-like cupin family protein